MQQSHMCHPKRDEGSLCVVCDRHLKQLQKIGSFHLLQRICEVLPNVAEDFSMMRQRLLEYCLCCRGRTFVTVLYPRAAHPQLSKARRVLQSHLAQVQTLDPANYFQGRPVSLHKSLAFQCPLCRGRWILLLHRHRLTLAIKFTLPSAQLFYNSSTSIPLSLQALSGEKSVGLCHTWTSFLDAVVALQRHGGSNSINLIESVDLI